MIELKQTLEELTPPKSPAKEYQDQHYDLQKEDRWKFFKEGILMGKALGELDVLEESDLRNLFEDFSIRNP